MNKHQEDIKAIFAEALAKKSTQELIQYLDGICGEDSALRDEIESLLAAHNQEGRFLEVLLTDSNASPADSPVSEAPGSTIDKYKLLEKIGEGGMAVVYMAQQEEPIKRKVALKIIKLGMDTKQVIARFEAERQALAIMDHPNIAKVIDAGATETGRPYFVMELVKGTAITDYCDKNKLSTKERLDLFVQVCSAVQHAHQKGIIHRDIKPTNVMVTLRDGKPVPKVIDFGIAKATSQKLTEKTLFTRYAQLIGTPAYMSPEQAESSELDIDTRTDIYSLGVLLYELITGTTPFDAEKLRDAGYAEIQRIIREEEPVKPSTKLSTLRETLTDVAEHRKASPEVLRKLVSGDLDWIVMKALEKDRTRRYETVVGLVEDIGRHLNSEPVLAAAPSALYRARKFIKRHRVGVVAGVVVVTALVAGITVATVGFVHASIQRERALSNFQRACAAVEEMMHLAQWTVYNDRTVKNAAQLQRNIVLKAQEFYQDLSEGNKSAPSLRRELGATYQVMGESSMVLREYEQAEQAYGQATEIFGGMVREHPDVAEFTRKLAYSQNGLSLALEALGRDEDAQEACRISVDLLKPWSGGASFGVPKSISPVVNSTRAESGPCISAAGLQLMFHSDRAGGLGSYDLWQTTRPALGEPWGVPVNLGETVNSPSYEGFPNITADGLGLYFDSYRPGGCGGGDLWTATRETTEDSWSAPENLGPKVNSPGLDGTPSISPDGLSLFFESDRPGGSGHWDLWVARRASVHDGWGMPENLGPTVNSPYIDQTPGISPDGLHLIFSSQRPGGFGFMGDLWMASRRSTSEAFSNAVLLPPMLNSAATEVGPNMSADGSTIYFVTYARPGGPGSWDLWEVPVRQLQQSQPTENVNGSITGDPAKK